MEPHPTPGRGWARAGWPRMPAVATEGTQCHQDPLPSGPGPVIAENGHWAQKNRTQPSQAPFFIKTHSLVFHSLKSHSKIGKGMPRGVSRWEGRVRQPSPRGRGRDTTHGSATGTRGHAAGGVAPRWAVALTGHGAVRLDSPGGTLTGQGWRGLAPPGPSCCAARPVQAGPLWSWADEAWPSPGDQGPLGPGEASCNTAHSCLSVVPEPGRLGWEEGGTAGWAAGPAANATLLLEPLGVRRLWGWRQPVTQGFFPSKGTGAQVTVARPCRQGDHGPLLHQTAGGQDSAGLCPWRRRGCGGKIQVVSLCCGLPRGRG